MRDTPSTSLSGKDNKMSTIVYRGTRLSSERMERGDTVHVYRVKLLQGSWPSDDDLVSLCNRDHPTNPRHWGGRVRRLDGGEAVVSVVVRRSARYR